MPEEEYEETVKTNVQTVIDALNNGLVNATIVEQETSTNEHGYTERKLYIDFRDGTEFIIVKVS